MEEKDKKILDELGDNGMRTEELKYKLSLREHMKNIIEDDGEDDLKRTSFLYCLCNGNDEVFQKAVDLLTTMEIFEKSLDKYNDDNSLVTDVDINI